MTATVISLTAFRGVGVVGTQEEKIAFSSRTSVDEGSVERIAMQTLKHEV